jgi:penicillin-binding protein 2
VTLNLAIGQGENVQTPLSMAYFYALLASPDGRAPSPHLVTARRDAVPRRLDLAPGALGGLREALVSVVEGGTAARSRVADLQIAGKTGSAQNAHGPDHGWFVAFAPADRPRVVVAAIVEFAEHGSVVAPMVTSIIAHYLQGAEPSDLGDARLALPDDSAPVPLPILPQDPTNARTTPRTR